MNEPLPPVIEIRDDDGTTTLIEVGQRHAVCLNCGRRGEDIGPATRRRYGPPGAVGLCYECLALPIGRRRLISTPERRRMQRRDHMRRRRAAGR